MAGQCDEVQKGFKDEHHTAGLEMHTLINRLKLRKREFRESVKDCTAKLKERLQ